MRPGPGHHTLQGVVLPRRPLQPPAVAVGIGLRHQEGALRGPATLAKLRPDLIRRHGGEGCDADDSSVSLVALVKFIVFPRGCLCWPVDVRLERLSGRRGYLDPTDLDHQRRLVRKRASSSRMIPT